MNYYFKRISESLIFRNARMSDVPAIMTVIKAAVAQMIAEGKQQWDESYPGKSHISCDVAGGTGYVLEHEGIVIGYAAVVFTGEPAYDSIDGKWLTNERYVVVHRLAVSQNTRNQGYGRAFMTAIENYAHALGFKSFKVDTNFDNERMLSLLDRLGFSYCGEIRYDRGVRKAFEKLI